MKKYLIFVVFRQLEPVSIHKTHLTEDIYQQ